MIQVNYRGDILAPSGYGRSIRAQMRALIEQGVEISGDHHQHDKTQLKDELCNHHAFWKQHMPKILADSGTRPIKIWHETPEFFNPDPTQYNIGFTLWETSRIPSYDVNGTAQNNWVKQMNRMDEMWSSSEFCLQAFRDSGVTVPTFMFPHPIDLDEYKPGRSVEGSFVIGNTPLTGKMVFLSVFQFTKRKNPMDLLLAWTAEFAHQDDVALVIKTYGSDFGGDGQIPMYVTNLRKSCRIENLSKNVHLILELVPESDMPSLYKMSDVFVLPSYGEGFGMPCQEAMACGKPVIYTDASSMPEFCVGYPIACDPEPVSGMINIPWYSADQDWWKVRVNDLRRQMRAAYNDWKSGTIEALGALARKRVEGLHSFDTVGIGMRTRLEAILKDIREGRCRSDLSAMWGTAVNL
jgi:glycosyltransferase involved in cell wall biosynthesis